MSTKRDDDAGTLSGLGTGDPSTMRKRTLRGIGPSRPRAADCAACHVRADEPPRLDSAIAVSFGIAIVFVRGVEGAKASLCDRHLRMVRALVDEMRGASKPPEEGGGPAW